MLTHPVLIIDDEPLVLKTLASILRLRLHVEVETSDSAVEALQRIRATDYAALVCDANQPRLPGVSFVRAVRKFRSETPVLLMLDQRDRDAGLQLIEAGAYDLLTKPIEEPLFLLALKRAIEVSRLRRQLRDQESKLLEMLDEALGDLEVLYHAYGLRAHLEAIIAKAKAEACLKVGPSASASAPTAAIGHGKRQSGREPRSN